MIVPLNETGTVQLNGSGAGTVRLTPDGSNEKWLPTVASVKVSTNTAEATCKIYCGQTATDNNFVDGTFSGSTGDATDRLTGNIVSFTQNRYIFAVWSGGDANAIATLNVVGTKEIK